MFAEFDLAQATIHGLGHQDRGMFDIGVDHGNATRLQPVEHRGFFHGDLGDIRKCLQVDGGDGGDHGNVRLRHLCQRRDFSGVVHADLDHGVFRIGRHPRERQRHTPVIVIAVDRGMRAPLVRKDREQHFLGRGFADAACHRDDLCLRAGTRGCAKRLERLEHIIDDQQRRIFGHALGHMGHQCSPCPFVQRHGDKVMPVAHILQRNKQIAWCNGAGINRHAVARPCADGSATCGAFSLFCCP